jgi:AraC-like DNA-binding protein
MTTVTEADATKPTDRRLRRPASARFTAPYAELPPAADLLAYVNCQWRRLIATPSGEQVRVLPDGCIDLLWIDGKLRVAGPDTTAHVGALAPGTRVVGIRFRPGVAPCVLGVPASSLLDARLDLAELGRFRVGDVEEQIAAAASDEQRAGIIQQALRRWLPGTTPPDPVVQQFVAIVQQRRGHDPIDISRIARELALSERQLRRRTLTALGYPPMTFVRLMRFQRFLACAREAQPRALTAIAHRVGFTDQPHLTRETVRIAGTTPARLVAELRRRSGHALNPSILEPSYLDLADRP